MIGHMHFQNCEENVSSLTIETLKPTIIFRQKFLKKFLLREGLRPTDTTKVHVKDGLCNLPDMVLSGYRFQAKKSRILVPSDTRS